MDHDHHDQHPVDGPWAGGWLVAAAAALIAAILARSIGEVGMTPAVVVGALVFAVFGVLLGSGGVELSAASGHDHDHNHDHGHH
jgi:hypothetical protein